MHNAPTSEPSPVVVPVVELVDAPPPTPAEVDGALAVINFALRSYERCLRRANARTAQGWADIACLLWNCWQGPAAEAVLPRGSDRRTFVRDRYIDADGWRATMRLREEGAELAEARAYLRGERPLFGSRPLARHGGGR